MKEYLIGGRDYTVKPLESEMSSRLFVVRSSADSMVRTIVISGTALSVIKKTGEFDEEEIVEKALHELVESHQENVIITSGDLEKYTKQKI